MDMTGEYRFRRRGSASVGAERSRGAAEAIAGREQLDKVSDTELTARVKAKVGPVSATFNGKATSRSNPPQKDTISGEGSGGMAGFAKGGANVHLTDEGTDTLLRYDAKADVGGKLAEFGSRLIQGTAKKMADDFFGRFSRIVAQSYAGSTAAAARATAPAGAATAETVAAMDPVPRNPAPPGSPGTVAGVEPQDRPPATPPGVPSPSFTSPSQRPSRPRPRTSSSRPSTPRPRTAARRPTCRPSGPQPSRRARPLQPRPGHPRSSRPARLRPRRAPRRHRHRPPPSGPASSSGRWSGWRSC